MYEEEMRKEIQAAQYAAKANAGSQYSLGMPSPEELARLGAENKRRKLIDNALNSLQRIAQALDMSRNEDANPLLKSDLQNASRHAVSLGKQLRLINKSLFPIEPKPAVSKPPAEQCELCTEPLSDSESAKPTLS